MTLTVMSLSATSNPLPQVGQDSSWCPKSTERNCWMYTLISSNWMFMWSRKGSKSISLLLGTQRLMLWLHMCTVSLTKKTKSTRSCVAHTTRHQDRQICKQFYLKAISFAITHSTWRKRMSLLPNVPPTCWRERLSSATPWSITMPFLFWMCLTGIKSLQFIMVLQLLWTKLPQPYRSVIVTCDKSFKEEVEVFLSQLQSIWNRSLVLWSGRLSPMNSKEACLSLRTVQFKKNLLKSLQMSQ